ncbi:MAG: A/G-specific adenine glycosylase [Evtepia sp.]
MLSLLPIPLLEWYSEHARTLPWRSFPTPYRVWVSEIMLQQTRVAAVLGYFSRFMDRFPSLTELAYASEDELMKIWQGLGYYSRARNLQKAAKQILSEFAGVFPQTYNEIRTLSGIGDYTAGAIASIAFGLPVPAVDGNVLRVVSRINGDSDDISTAAMKKKVTQELYDIMPTAYPGEFNQALMELGATLCIPNGTPLCEHCPAFDFCVARCTDQTDVLPVRAPKKARRIEERTVFFVFHENKVALRRRPPKGLLARLWEFPSILVGESLPEILRVETMKSGGMGKHIFTHIEWHMTAQIFVLEQSDLPEDWVWADRNEVNLTYPIPAAFDSFRKILDDYCA